MRVISTVPKVSRGRHGWMVGELEALMRLYASQSGRRRLVWATAVTELDDPQFFLMDAGGDADCLVAVSRVGGTYVLEDGEGWLLCESCDLAEVVDKAQATLATRHRPRLVAKLVLSIGAIKTFVDEKVEPLVPDYIEAMLPIAQII